MKFIDLFAGIGGVKIAFQNAGFECVFSNDIDKNCAITFNANFSDGLEYKTKLVVQDISDVTSKRLPDFDILTGGFPCQPFSIAGYRKGFSDEGRGDLFFEVIRILRDKKPKAVLLENVKNLKTHDGGKTLELIYNELENLGYYVYDKVLNTMNYGNIPQNRERIYIVGFLDKEAYIKFSFPEPIILTKKIHDCLEDNVNDLFYYKKGKIYEELKKDIDEEDTLYQRRRKYVRKNKNKVCPTLTANMGTGGHNVPILKDKKGIRKLTPRECANLQGFPKEYILPNIANSHLYKQFGNSVSIPVVERIAKNMFLSLSR